MPQIIIFPSLVFLFLIAPENFSRAFIFFLAVHLKKYQTRTHILAACTLLLDIYHSEFIGLTFAMFWMLNLLSDHYRANLQNFSEAIRIGYMIGIFIGCDLLIYCFVLFTDGTFNFINHLEILSEFIAFNILYELYGLINYANR